MNETDRLYIAISTLWKASSCDKILSNSSSDNDKENTTNSSKEDFKSTSTSDTQDVSCDVMRIIYEVCFYKLMKKICDKIT